MKILHFADAHIDMANYGRHDPTTGLPMRVLDFLKSLDTIVDTAIKEKVDLVIFAGDAYKDRTPAPTFQREWGRRIMRLSRAGIPTLLLVGNHDLSPAVGRANAVQEFDTLSVPHVQVVSKPSFLRPKDLENLPVQILALPWVSRSALMGSTNMSGMDPEQIYAELETRLTGLVQGWMDEIDERYPVIMTAHASVQGAKLGTERAVMLGADLVLPGSMVKDPRLDYVALGHIHKPQDLNAKSHPPVIYPGSIERVDFGEVNDDKFFIIAEVQRGKTEVRWVKLEEVRPFIDRHVTVESDEAVTERILATLPENGSLRDAIVRLTIRYPRHMDDLIDEAALREYAKETFEFHLVRRPLMDNRARLAQDNEVSRMDAASLLDMYWKSNHTDEKESDVLKKMAEDIIHQVESEG